MFQIITKAREGVLGIDSTTNRLSKYGSKVNSHTMKPYLFEYLSSDLRREVIPNEVIISKKFTKRLDKENRRRAVFAFVRKSYNGMRAFGQNLARNKMMR